MAKSSPQPIPRGFYPFRCYATSQWILRRSVTGPVLTGGTLVAQVWQLEL